MGEICRIISTKIIEDSRILIEMHLTFADPRTINNFSRRKRRNKNLAMRIDYLTVRCKKIFTKPRQQCQKYLTKSEK
jgi:hypothetical protein